ncbi:MAG: DUF5615 family PIN-like protein [Verrucomicrobiales bacterium]
MKGFLFDENLPVTSKVQSQFPIFHVTQMGESPGDSEVWDYARTNDLAIVSKDSDFSDRIRISGPPPRVIHLRIGNMRRREFDSFLQRNWERLESLIQRHKLLNVYSDEILSIG